MRFLHQEVSEGEGANKVLILNGKSGVGKSELTRRFLEKNAGRSSVKVEIGSLGNFQVADGYYLRRIGAALNAAGSGGGEVQPFVAFLSGINSEVIRDRLFRSNADDKSMELFFGKPKAEVLKSVSTSGEESLHSIFSSEKTENVAIVESYVSAQLKAGDLILNIENIQRVDAYSLERIFQFLRYGQRNIAILEYTTDDEMGVPLSELISKAGDNNLVVRSFSVDPLNFDDFRRIINDHPDSAWKIIQSSFANWNGNLRPLIDLISALETETIIVDQLSGGEITVNDGTLIHIQSIPKDEQFLLALVITHRDPVMPHWVSFTNQTGIRMPLILDAIGCITSLVSRKLLRNSGDYISVAHDSIVGLFEQHDRFKLLFMLASSYWFEFYSRLDEYEPLYITRSQQLSKTLLFASLLNDHSKVISLLEVIRDEIARTRFPRAMFGYVEAARAGILESLSPATDVISRIEIWLIEMYLKANLAFESLKILNSSSVGGRNETVLRGIIYEQIGQQESAIKILDAALAEVDNPEGDRYAFVLNIIRMVCLYDLGKYKACNDAFYRLIADPHGKDYFEYGFLLRNAELIFDYKGCIPYLKMSAEFFEERESKEQEAYSRMGLGVHLALTGDLDGGSSEINTANSLLAGSNAERQSLLNNIAVIRLFRGQKDKETIDLFREALATSNSDFEKVAISSNYLALMDWTGNILEAELAIDTINRHLISPAFANKYIKRYAYYNIHKFYEKMGDDISAQLYLNKINELGLTKSPIWKKYLDGIPIDPEDEEAFVATLDRPISYLTHWNMDYDNSQMQY